MGPRAGLDAVEKKKTLASAVNRTLDVQPVAIPTEVYVGNAFALGLVFCRSSLQKYRTVYQ
jgi:hypothetical protein